MSLQARADGRKGEAAARDGPLALPSIETRACVSFLSFNSSLRPPPFAARFSRHHRSDTALPLVAAENHASPVWRMPLRLSTLRAMLRRLLQRLSVAPLRTSSPSVLLSLSRHVRSLRSVAKGWTQRVQQATCRGSRTRATALARQPLYHHQPRCSAFPPLCALFHIPPPRSGARMP